MHRPITSSGSSSRGQKRGVTPQIKRELRRRSAVEPVIGHLEAEHRMGRNYLRFRRGDAANAAVRYNFRRLIRWLRLLLRQILSALLAERLINPTRNQGFSRTTRHSADDRQSHPRNECWHRPNLDFAHISSNILFTKVVLIFAAIAF
jgi:IS5 family transposase